ncbi:hypothetical protein LXA43DRAFT_877608 [Ganoderma leucocontextum]|nr:hypothetical protein LXA43DRAFT_877608 [Ganoderma leucocontextum]
MVAVVDIEGVQELLITFCSCPNTSSEPLQLLYLGYYPASGKWSQTVFTFRALDDFLLTNKECKVSPRNYYNFLWRKSNSAFPHIVPVGEHHPSNGGISSYRSGPDLGFGHTKKSVGLRDLTVRCSHCPQPDINLPDNWKEDPERWKYILSAVLDGNFSAQHQQMKNPEDDVPLADGHGFMVKDQPYKEYLKMVVEIKQMSGDTVHHSAGRKTTTRGAPAVACPVSEHFR